MVIPENAHTQGCVGVVIHVMAGVFDQNVASEILLGLEEEQVPYKVQTVDYKSDGAIAMAYQAGIKSIFGVGICISPDMIALHYIGLPKDNPLLIIPIKASDPKEYRILGHNAAKFIKGRPFDKI